MRQDDPTGGQGRLDRLWDCLQELRDRGKIGVFSKHDVRARTRDEEGNVVGPQIVRAAKAGELPLADSQVRELLDALVANPDDKIKEKALYLRHWYQDRLHPQAIRVTQVLDEELQRMEWLRQQSGDRKESVQEAIRESHRLYLEKRNLLTGERDNLTRFVGLLLALLHKAAEYYGVEADYFIPVEQPRGWLRRLFSKKKKKLKEPQKKKVQDEERPSPEELSSLAARHNLPLLVRKSEGHPFPFSALFHPVLAGILTCGVGLILGFTLTELFAVPMAEESNWPVAIPIILLGVPLAFLGRYGVMRGAFNVMQRHYLLFIGSHVNEQHPLDENAQAVYRSERARHILITGTIILLILLAEVSVQFTGVSALMNRAGLASNWLVAFGVCAFLTVTYLSYSLLEGLLLGEDSAVRNYCRSIADDAGIRDEEQEDWQALFEEGQTLEHPVQLINAVGNGKRVDPGVAAAIGALYATFLKRIEAIHVEVDTMDKVQTEIEAQMRLHAPDVPDDFDENAIGRINDAIADWEHAQEEFDRMLPAHVTAGLTIRAVVQTRRRNRKVVERSDWWAVFVRAITFGKVKLTREVFEE